MSELIPQPSRIGGYQIECVRDGAPLDVQAYWYKIYVEELGHEVPEADHGQGLMDDSMAVDGRLYIARSRSGEVAGTVLTVDRGDGDLKFYPEYFDMDRVGGPATVTTKLTVAPFARQSRVSFQLSRATYQDALQRGVQHDFVDCQPNRLMLFQRMGYRELSGVADHPVYGPSIRLQFDLHDYEHLERVGSPLAPVARRQARSQAG